MRDRHSLPILEDTRQTIWQLLAIQLSGWTSLPILATSVFLLGENNFYGSLFTIIVANALLWFIRMAIILMSYKNRQSTLDLAQDYLGKFGGYCIAFLLLFSTLVWFITQTSAASDTLTRLIRIKEHPEIDQFTQVSVLLGVASTLFCMEGMVILRKLSTFSFPIVLTAFFIVIAMTPFQLPIEKTASFSLQGLTIILITNLGFTADLPTFFRHSRSLYTSIIALTVLQILSIILAILGLFLGAIITSDKLQINESVIITSGNSSLVYFFALFVFISTICANVANVYSSSVGWEIIAPSALVGRKEYLILGLGLTTIFILVSKLFSVDHLLHTADSSLVNLTLVLIFAYLIKQITKGPISLFSQWIYLTAWMVSTIVNTLQINHIAFYIFSPIVTSLIIIFFTFMLGFLVKWIHPRLFKTVKL